MTQYVTIDFVTKCTILWYVFSDFHKTGRLIETGRLTFETQTLRLSGAFNRDFLGKSRPGRLIEQYL